MAPLLRMLDGRDATPVGIRGIHSLVEEGTPEGHSVSNLSIFRQRVTQDGVWYGTAWVPSRMRRTAPSLLRWGRDLDPTGFLVHRLLIQMIKPIEDAFGPHKHDDGQAQANGARDESGRGLTEAPEPIPHRPACAKPHE